MSFAYEVKRRRNATRFDPITTYSVVGLSDDQQRVLRETAIGAARTQATLNGWNTVVYGPTETSTAPTADDMIWDSATDL